MIKPSSSCASPAALLALALAFMLSACGDGGSTTAPTVLTGDPPDDVPGRGATAPMFAGELLSGDSLSLDGLKGQPVIVNFWATTCAPCIREMPALADTARDHEEEGLVVIGVNYGETVAMIERFIDAFEFDLGFPIMLDDRGEIGRLFKVVVFPTTYFIDRDGIIQYRRLGELEDRHLEEGLARIM